MRRLAAPALVVLIAAVAGYGFARWYSAPAPGSGGNSLASAQLATEQRLLCPQCTGTRLDVCDRPICLDMKADIARRLAAGEAADSIVSGYRTAFGPSVVAGSPPDGSTVAPGLLVAAAVLFAVSALLLGRLLAWRRRRTGGLAGWSTDR